MKKLEELGISPAPWRVDTDKLGNENDVLCDYKSDLFRKGDKRTKVVVRCNAHFETFKADIHLIAAAPELYKWLAYAVEHYKCETRSCDNCPKSIIGISTSLTTMGCVLPKMRSTRRLTFLSMLLTSSATQSAMMKSSERGLSRNKHVEMIAK